MLPQFQEQQPTQHVNVFFSSFFSNWKRFLRLHTRWHERGQWPSGPYLVSDGISICSEDGPVWSMQCWRADELTSDLLQVNSHVINGYSCNQRSVCRTRSNQLVRRVSTNAVMYKMTTKWHAVLHAIYETFLLVYCTSLQTVTKICFVDSLDHHYLFITILKKNHLLLALLIKI